MRSKKISTLLLIIMAVTMLVVLAFRVTVGATADSVAVLSTTGMTCGSCSDKITQALQSVKGVAVAEVDVAGGWVIVGYDTKTTGPAKLAQKIGEAGFGSKVYAVLTPEQFRDITGRELGKNSSAAGCGGCGTKGGCGAQNQ